MLRSYTCKLDTALVLVMLVKGYINKTQRSASKIPVVTETKGLGLVLSVKDMPYQTVHRLISC